MRLEHMSSVLARDGGGTAGRERELPLAVPTVGGEWCNGSTGGFGPPGPGPIPGSPVGGVRGPCNELRIDNAEGDANLVISYHPAVAPPVVVILAAGEGTRMRSQTPKLLHHLCGRPLIAWSVAAAREAGAEKIVVVQGPERALDAALSDDIVVAIQERPRGTADAVRSAGPEIRDADAVIVCNGDHPLSRGHAP